MLFSIQVSINNIVVFHPVINLGFNNIVVFHPVSQWEPPPEFQQSQIPDTCQQSTTEQPALTTSGEASASEHNTGQKRTAEEADLEKLYEPPKRAAGPYGSWKTVAER